MGGGGAKLENNRCIVPPPFGNAKNPFLVNTRLTFLLSHPRSFLISLYKPNQDQLTLFYYYYIKEKSTDPFSFFNLDPCPPSIDPT